MKTIVCYGDSNTWGFIPKKDEVTVPANNRYPWGVRWTSLLQIALGGEYRVEEEGVNGRTTVFDDPFCAARNGFKNLESVMLSKMPVDMVMIALGSNDVKELINASAYASGMGARKLINAVQTGGYGINGNSPEILLISPIRLNPALINGWLGEEFGQAALERDAQLPRQMREAAQACGVHFLDASVISADEADGVHMNAEGHAHFARLVLEKTRSILG